jgi:hypothetical protein
MLATLTCLSGAYAITNKLLTIQNKYLLKQNKLRTLNGVYNIRKVNVTKTGIMYKFATENSTYVPTYIKVNGTTKQCGGYFPKSNEYLAHGYNFLMENTPIFSVTQDTNFIFNNEIHQYINNNYEFYCIAHEIGHIQYATQLGGGVHYKRFNGVNLHVVSTRIRTKDDIWVLCDGNDCKIMANVNEDVFKQLLLKRSQLPFNKTNLFLLYALLIICYGYYFYSHNPDEPKL